MLISGKEYRVIFYHILISSPLAGQGGQNNNLIPPWPYIKESLKTTNQTDKHFPRSLASDKKIEFYFFVRDVFNFI